MAVRRALLSVSDKTGLVPFARRLGRGASSCSPPAGTQKALAEAGLRVIPVGEYTAAPEILGGRVKTLHPRVHGGILYRRGLPSDEADVAARDIPPIDLVVVNLYPFREAVAAGKPFDDVRRGDRHRWSGHGPQLRQELGPRGRGGRPGRLRARRRARSRPRAPSPTPPASSS